MGLWSLAAQGGGEAAIGLVRLVVDATVGPCSASSLPGWTWVWWVGGSAGENGHAGKPAGGPGAAAHKRQPAAAWQAGTSEAFAQQHPLGTTYLPVIAQKASLEGRLQSPLDHHSAVHPASPFKELTDRCYGCRCCPPPPLAAHAPRVRQGAGCGTD